ncbi:MAG TPA: VTT domain-containing protein [Acidobacteriaceae bacterium]|nr:VTT domain-containing protein [Acidobacteriaceae bacterium]
MKSARSGHGLHWLMSFGTLGLFVVSAIDSSIIPLPVPGSTDLLLILLIAHRADPVFAAAAAIVGSILGGYLTWATGAKGGEAALHRHLPKRFGRRFSGWVGESGTVAVTAAALLPPPFPLMPLLLAAGALGVSRKRFLISFSVARTFRYALVAWLAATYGRAVERAFRHYLSGWSTTLMWIYLGMVAAGILYGVWKFRHQRRQSPVPRTAALSPR